MLLRSRKYNSKDKMSSAFGRVLLLDVLLGLRIQPVLAQTVESICAFCLVHGQRVKLFETRIDAQSVLTFAAFVTGSMMEGCPGHLVQQQSDYSICWFPPPTRQAAHRGRVSKKSHMQRSLMHGSMGHADE